MYIQIHSTLFGNTFAILLRSGLSALLFFLFFFFLLNF